MRRRGDESKGERRKVIMPAKRADFPAEWGREDSELPANRHLFPDGVSSGVSRPGALAAAPVTL
jgi:hypothetical protein